MLPQQIYSLQNQYDDDASLHGDEQMMTMKIQMIKTRLILEYFCIKIFNSNFFACMVNFLYFKHVQEGNTAISIFSSMLTK